MTKSMLVLVILLSISICSIGTEILHHRTNKTHHKKHRHHSSSSLHPTEENDLLFNASHLQIALKVKEHKKYLEALTQLQTALETTIEDTLNHHESSETPNVDLPYGNDKCDVIWKGYVNNLHYFDQVLPPLLKAVNDQADKTTDPKFSEVEGIKEIIKVLTTGRMTWKSRNFRNYIRYTHYARRGPWESVWNFMGGRGEQEVRLNVFGVRVDYEQVTNVLLSGARPEWIPVAREEESTGTNYRHDSFREISSEPNPPEEDLFGTYVTEGVSLYDPSQLLFNIRHGAIETYKQGEALKFLFEVYARKYKVPKKDRKFTVMLLSSGLAMGDDSLIRAERHALKQDVFDKNYPVLNVELNQQTRKFGHGKPLGDCKTDFEALLNWGATDLVGVIEGVDTKKILIDVWDLKQWDALIDAIKKATAIEAKIIDFTTLTLEQEQSKIVAGKAYTIAKCMRAVAELYTDTIDHTTSLFRIFAASVVLEATPSMNCKSGCDRTSLAHTISMTVWQTMVSLSPFHGERQGDFLTFFTVLDILLDWTNKVTEVDKSVTFQTYSKELKACYDLPVLDDVPSFIKGSKNTERDKTFTGLKDKCTILFMQVGLFYNLMEISWRVVAWNTAVTGFKFGVRSEFVLFGAAKNFIYHSPHWTPIFPIRINSVSKAIQTRKGLDMSYEFSVMLNDASEWRGSAKTKTPWNKYRPYNEIWETQDDASEYVLPVAKNKDAQEPEDTWNQVDQPETWWIKEASWSDSWSTEAVKDGDNNKKDIDKDGD